MEKTLDFPGRSVINRAPLYCAAPLPRNHECQRNYDRHVRCPTQPSAGISRFFGKQRGPAKFRAS
jgi:hypothetical protein